MSQKKPSKSHSSESKSTSKKINKIVIQKHSEQIMLARLRLGEFAYTHSLDEVLQATLDEAESLTGSSIGFYHFLEEDQKTLSLQAWSTRTLKEFCTAEGKGLHYSIDQAGVWVDCVRERRPVIHNDYASISYRKGLPEGHAAVIRELVIPICRADQIVAIIGVGNKPIDYDEDDIKAASLLADLAWDIAERKRAEIHIQYLSRLYAILSQVNQAILRIKSEEELLKKICNIVVDVGKFHMAWIGLIDETRGNLKPAVHAGADGGYKQYSEGTSTSRLNCTIDSAVRTAKVTAAQCTPQDRGKNPQTDATNCSFASIPFSVKSKVKGVLNLCASGLVAFDQTEMTLLDEIGADISFALDAMELAREQKQAEEKLQKSETLLNEAQHLAHIGSWELDIANNVLTWSDEIYRLFEIDREKFGASYEAFLDAIHPDDREMVNLAYTNSLKARTLYSIDHRLRFADGRIKYVREQCETFYDADGNPLRSVGTVQDFTERKVAEDALRQSEERFRRLAENAQDVIYRMSLPNGNYEYVSPAARSVFGYAPEEWYNNPKLIKQAIHPDWQKYFEEQWANLINGDVPSTYEYQIIHKSGEIRWLNQRNILIRNETSQPVALEGIVTDITERKRVEEKAKQLAAIVQSSEDAIIGKTLKGIITSWNKGAEKIYGYAESEVIGKPISILTPPGKEQEVQQILDRLRVGEHIEHYEAVRRRKDGREIHMSLTISPILDTEGNVIAASTIGRDITERKRAEEALRFSEEKFLKAFRSSPIALTLAELYNGTLVEANDAFEQITGYSLTDAIGKNASELNLYPDPSERERLVKELKSKGSVHRAEMHIRHKSGEPRIVLCSVEPLTIGKSEYVLSATEDITERKRAEEALRSSESRLRKNLAFQERLIASLPTISFITTDLNAIVTSFSPGSEKMFNYRAEEMIGQPVAKLHPPEDAAKLAEIVQTQIAGQVGYEGETILVRKNGERFPAQFITSPLRNEEGKVIALLGVSQDITERKQTEFELVKLRKAVDTSGEAIFMTDREGIITYVNPGFTALYGYSAAEVIGKVTPRILKSKALDSRTYEDFWKTLLDQKEARREFINETKDGKQIQIEGSANPILDEKDNIIGFLAIQRDITERKRAAESLKESETRLLSLIQATPDAIFFKDGKGHWLLANSSALGLFDLEGKAYTGKTDAELAELVPFFKEAFAYCTASDEQAWKASRLTHAEEIIPKRDGSYRVFDVIKIPLFHDDGSRKGLVIVGRDITERRQADEERHKLEQELMQAQKLESLGTLASGIAHDFNNILGIILGYTSLLERTPSDPEKIRHGINAIQRATLRGASIVKQLLTIAHKGESAFVPVSINHVIEDITNLLQETLPKTIDMTANLQPEMPSISADMTQVHQVLLNLCVNARDAMPKGGKLTITSSTIGNQSVVTQFPKAKAREYVMVKVTDTGTGMDEKTKQRIFDPFFTTKGPGKGTGLGLALVYSIVESHHGMISVESAPDKGTTFSLFFPAEEGTIECSPPPSSRFDDIPGGTETILLIEDEEIFAELIKGALTTKGYTVLTAHDGEKGLELFHQHQGQIGLVISDLALPKCRGDEVFKLIKAIDPRARVILAGGFIEPTLRLELLQMGLKQFIQKPYSPSDILRAIRHAIDGGG